MKMFNSLRLVTLGGLVVFALTVGGSALARGDKESGKAWLGVYLHEIDDETKEAWDLPSTEGVMVDDVVKESPAEKAGLKAGDVIVKFDGRPVSSSTQLRRLISRAQPDTTVTLDIVRDKKNQQVAVTLGESEDGDLGFFGDRDFSFEIPEPPDVLDRPLPAPRAFRFYAAESPVRIGIQLINLSRQLREYFGVQDGGVLVEEIIKDSPAEKAGLKAGDVIVEIEGGKVGDADDVVDDLRDRDPGDKVNVAVVRKGARQTFSVILQGDDERSGHRAILRKYGMGPRPPADGGFTWDSDKTDRQRETTDEIRESIRELRDKLDKTKEELWKALRELQDKKG